MLLEVLDVAYCCLLPLSAEYNDQSEFRRVTRTFMLAVVTLISWDPTVSCDKVEEGICDIPESRSPGLRGSWVDLRFFSRFDRRFFSLLRGLEAFFSLPLDIAARCGLAIAGPADSRHLTSTACPTGTDDLWGDMDEIDRTNYTINMHKRV